MLVEVTAAKSHDGVLRQRWFTDEDFDLTVWQTEAGEFHGFQLAYDKRAAPVESILTWKELAGFDVTHLDVGSAHSSPVLRPGGRHPDATLLEKFRVHAKSLEPSLKRALIVHLRDCIRHFATNKKRVRKAD